MECQKYLSITGLPVSNAMQKFLITGDNIYTLQYASKTKNQYLSRCDLKGSCISHVVLIGCGHSQTLDYYNNKLMVAIKPTASVKAVKAWAIQLGYISYKSISSYTKADRITNIVSNIERIEASMSPNKKEVMIYTRNRSGDKNILVYNSEMLKKLNGGVALSELSRYKLYKRKITIKALPYDNSIQGVAIDNEDNIYMVGGAIGQKPQIRKSTWNGSKYITESVTLDNPDFDETTEPESIQIIGDYIYIGVSNKSHSEKAVIYILEKF